MQRRRFLAALAAASSLAGCQGGTGDGTETVSRESTSTATATASSADDYDSSLAAQGVPTTICSEAIQSEPGIYAIDEPAFGEDWTGRDVSYPYRAAMEGGNLAADHTVVGLEADGRARAYPLAALAEHEVVNDDFGGPVLVTYCPICQSGMVAERRVGGEETIFAVSGLLWQPERIQVAAAEQDNSTFGAQRSGGEEVDVRASGNLVMYDRATGSYWSQILARSICGSETGTHLSIRPSTLTTWGEWRAEHPGTDVLLPAPFSGTHFPDEHAGSTPEPDSSA